MKLYCIITDGMVNDKVLLSIVGQQGGHIALPAVGERPHLLLLCLKPHLHLVSVTAGLRMLNPAYTPVRPSVI